MLMMRHSMSRLCRIGSSNSDTIGSSSNTIRRRILGSIGYSGNCMDHVRPFQSGRVLLKRRDGASGSIVKVPRAFGRKKTTRWSPHEDVVRSKAKKEAEARALAKKEAAFAAFEQDTELLQEYDRAFEEVINSGRIVKCIDWGCMRTEYEMFGL